MFMNQSINTNFPRFISTGFLVSGKYYIRRAELFYIDKNPNILTNVAPNSCKSIYIKYTFDNHHRKYNNKSSRCAFILSTPTTKQ